MHLRTTTSRRPARVAVLTLLVVAVAFVVAGCGDLLKDSTFRLWCGESLCEWKTETGRIQRAATWHPKDYGVEFVDTPTVISQGIDAHPGCVEFTTIADVEPRAQVTIGFDFDGDGVPDYEQPVAATGFREAKTQVTMPRRYRSLRFFIAKKGVGRAVLAEVRLTAASGCVAPPIRFENLPLGSACTLGAPSECSSGVCCEGICAECCVGAIARDVLVDGAVVQQTTPVPCLAGGACGRRLRGTGGGDLFSWFFASVPLQCDPGSRTKAAGAECIADDDCASGTCVGARVDAEQRTSPGHDDAGQVDYSRVDRTPCVPAADAGDCLVTHVHGGRCK